MNSIIKENLWLLKKLRRSEHERKILEDSRDKSVKLSNKIVKETNEAIRNINRDFIEINENLSIADIKNIVALITNKINSLNDKQYMTKNHFQLLNNLLDLFSKILKLNTINERNTAIAQITQMLAHDVRKPFSMLNMILDQLESCCDPGEIKEMVRDYIPAVRNSITEVNWMVNDVMELGRTAKPVLEPSSLESIIESSLIEATRIYSKVNIIIKYFFNHLHAVNIDTLKIGRVFSNIIGNAFQAIGNQGEIWITTKEECNFIKVSIGNKGSFISKNDIDNLFDAFYTRNKPNGTGLGLAIAQKIVTAHGGKIWCRSSKKNSSTEFFFTLPLIKIKSNYDRSRLPISTNEIVQNFKRTYIAKGKNHLTCINDPREFQFEKEIIKKSKNKKIKLAIIDDEAIYRNALKNLVERSEGLSNAIEIITYKDSSSAFKGIEESTPDIIICDIDLGHRSLSGFKITEVLRNQNIHVPICIHSNKSLPEDYAKAIKVGAQAFLPKPMTRVHLLKFIVES